MKLSIVCAAGLLLLAGCGGADSAAQDGPAQAETTSEALAGTAPGCIVRYHWITHPLELGGDVPVLNVQVHNTCGYTAAVSIGYKPPWSFGREINTSCIYIKWNPVWTYDNADYDRVQSCSCSNGKCS
jgi:hypothetical protein